MAARRALITGITGQDGSYLAELLLKKGYHVSGVIRRTSLTSEERLWRIRHLMDQIDLIEGDVTEQASIERALTHARPDEVYHLAAQSFLPDAFDDPLHTVDVNGIAVVRLLETARRMCPQARIYQASAAEMFGNAVECPQRETTPFRPRSPYALAKLLAHQAMVMSREVHGMFTCCGIVFSHESERRGLEYVTRKITSAGARIKAGLQQTLSLGNLSAQRDWSYAPEVMEGAWRMLQQDEPDDYVLASGETHSVREFLETAFGLLGLDPDQHVVIDERLLRPVGDPVRCGDIRKARQRLDWHPQVGFKELVRIMVEADCARVAQAVAVPRSAPG